MASHFAETPGRYAPCRDTWRPLSTNEFFGGEYSTAVWGGYDGAGQILITGARYDPSTDTWAPLSTSGAPSPRLNHAAVWIDDQMIVWGAADRLGAGMETGGRYFP